MALKDYTAAIGANATLVEDGKKVPNPHAGQSVTVEYDFGDTLNDLVQLVVGSGKSQEEAEAIVFSNAVANMVIGLQSGIRTRINADQDSDTIKTWASGWVPGAASSRSKKSKAEKIADILGDDASEDDIEATLKFLREKRKAAA